MQEKESVDLRNDCWNLHLLSCVEFWRASLWERKKNVFCGYEYRKKTWHEQNVFSFHMRGVQLFPSPFSFCSAFIFPVWIVGGDISISANASPTQLLKGTLLSKTDFFCFFIFFLPNNPCLLLAVDHQNKLTKSVNGPSKTVWTINH